MERVGKFDQRLLEKNLAVLLFNHGFENVTEDALERLGDLFIHLVESFIRQITRAKLGMSGELNYSAESFYKYLYKFFISQRLPLRPASTSPVLIPVRKPLKPMEHEYDQPTALEDNWSESLYIYDPEKGVKVHWKDVQTTTSRKEESSFDSVRSVLSEGRYLEDDSHKKEIVRRLANIQLELEQCERNFYDNNKIMTENPAKYKTRLGIDISTYYPYLPDFPETLGVAQKTFYDPQIRKVVERSSTLRIAKELLSKSFAHLNEFHKMASAREARYRDERSQAQSSSRR